MITKKEIVMPDTDEVTEQRIRERAFQLWQDAGCPEGRADEFWHLAKEAETKAPTDLIEDAAGHYPPTGDTQNFA